MSLPTFPAIILGQEAICPDGLGRVADYNDQFPDRWIQVDTYVKNRGCRWDVENVTLISPLPWTTFDFTTVAGLMQGQEGLSDKERACPVCKVGLGTVKTIYAADGSDGNVLQCDACGHRWPVPPEVDLDDTESDENN